MTEPSKFYMLGYYFKILTEPFHTDLEFIFSHNNHTHSNPLAVLKIL